MRRIAALALVAAVCALGACKKEPTPGERLDNAIDKTNEKATELKNDLEKR
jgi:hypothetical protein